MLTDAIMRNVEEAAARHRQAQESLAPRGPPPSVLTTVSAIRGTAAAEARHGIPVRLRAVVTVGTSTAAFVQDSTAGIYMVRGTTVWRPGRRWTSSGGPRAGDFAPIIDKVTVRVVGTAPHPEPIRVPLSELFTGRYAAVQWVEAEGIVQAVGRQNTTAFLAVVSGPFSYRVVFPTFGDQPLPTHLIDTKVQIRGACRHDLQRATPVARDPAVETPDPTYVTVLEPAPADPLAFPVQPINALMRFNPGKSTGHRVRIQGIATLRLSDGTVYVKDATGGLLVNHPARSVRSHPAIGWTWRASVRRVSICRCCRTRSSSGSSPARLRNRCISPPTRRSGAITGLGSWFEWKATWCIESVSTVDQVLTLRAGRHTFQVSLEGCPAQDALPTVAAGSVLRVTGIVW